MGLSRNKSSSQLQGVYWGKEEVLEGSYLLSLIPPHPGQPMREGPLEQGVQEVPSLKQ